MCKVISMTFEKICKFLSGIIGAILGYMYGQDNFELLYALCGFIFIDYITGIIVAIQEKKLNSQIGFKGICNADHGV